MNKMNMHPYATIQQKTTSMNPVITSIYTADPSAHVWNDGKIYVYASHDVDPPRGCDLMDRYHVFSSEDMVHWQDEGEILNSDEVSWGRQEGGFMWAPDCAYRNGTYYFYYPHPSGSDWNDTWKIGVATSDKPASGFIDQGYIQGLGGFAMIDPAVWVDDDNRAYMYYGGGGVCAGVELNDDMMTIHGDVQVMEGLEDFHEAAWVFKREGQYYLTYADNLEGNNRMRYATSDHPLGLGHIKAYSWSRRAVQRRTDPWSSSKEAGICSITIKRYQVRELSGAYVLMSCTLMRMARSRPCAKRSMGLSPLREGLRALRSWRCMRQLYAKWSAVRSLNKPRTALPLQPISDPIRPAADLAISKADRLEAGLKSESSTVRRNAWLN